MTNLSIVELDSQHVELLPDRMTMTGGTNIGGSAGNGGLGINIIGGAGLLTSGNNVANVASGGNGGAAGSILTG